MGNKNIVKPIGIRFFQSKEEDISFILATIVLSMYMVVIVIDSIITLNGSLMNCIDVRTLNDLVNNKYFIKCSLYFIIIIFSTISFYSFTNRSYRFRVYMFILNIVIISTNIYQNISDFLNMNQFNIFFIKRIVISVVALITIVYIIKSKKVEKLFCK